MAISKVLLNNVVQMDVTGTTATPPDVLSPKVFTQANGVETTGTGSGGGGGGDTWSWMGRNPALIETFPKQHLSFSELGVGEWTYSTSQSTLRSAQSRSPNLTCYLNDYDYILVYKIAVTYDYGNWTPIGAPSVFSFCSAYSCTGLCSGVSAITTGTENTFGGSSDNIYGLLYYATSGTLSYSSSGTYGVYSSSITMPTTSGDISTYYLATVKTPTISIRGSASYFTETAFNNLDLNNSYYDLTIEAWRVDVNTSDRKIVLDMYVDALNNGI